jgi:hypothetical protein
MTELLSCFADAGADADAERVRVIQTTAASHLVIGSDPSCLESHADSLSAVRLAVAVILAPKAVAER